MSKGQTQVIEIVILFGIGIMIVAGFVAAFEGFGEDVREEAIESQGQVFGDTLSSHIAFLAATGADYGEVSFSMPSSLAGENYHVDLTDTGIGVYIGDQAIISNNLNGLEHRYDLEGSVQSTYDLSRIRKGDQNISIGG